MLRLAAISLTYEQGLPTVQPALTGVSLHVTAGDRLGLCGPSGAGKSSLLLVMAGLYPPTAGFVEFSPGTRVALALQEPELALFSRTVREELAFAPRQLGVSGNDLDAVTRQTMAEIGLPEALLDEDPLNLSSAERRLVGLGAVLTGRPNVLLLDEPTAGLENTYRMRVAELVRAYPGAVVVASHDLDLLWRSCRRFLLLDRGRLASAAGWGDLVARPDLLARVGLEPPAPLMVLSGLVKRGWSLDSDPGYDEQEVARVIVAGGP